MPSSPIWISHRGYHKERTENTLEAFEASVAMGFKELETDLRLTRDGHLVLCHDPSLKRVLGEDILIHEKSRQELEELVLPGGERLLFFDQFYEAFQGPRWTLDIKPEGGDETLHALFAWAYEHDALETLRACRFLLWKADHEAILRTYLHDAAVYARPEECWRAGLWTLLGLPWLGKIQPGRIYSLVPKVAGIPVYRRRVIDAYHKRGATTLAFLPEDPKDTRDAIDAGIDYILTNHEILP